MSKAKIEYSKLESSGSDQNGMHLLGSSLGDEDDKLYDLQEEAMRRDGLTEVENKSIPSSNFKENRKKIMGELNFMTPMQGMGMGTATSPPQAGLLHGLSAGSVGGGEGVVTKKFVINDEEAMIEEARRLDLEVKHYDLLLKRARLEAMKTELMEISPEKNVLSGITDSRDREGLADQNRRRDMLKIVVPDFKRGDADEVLNSITNFNYVLRACGLEAVAYLDKVGSAEEEMDLATLVQRLVSKDSEVVASMRAEFGERGGRGSEMMKHLRDYFVNTLVYESTDAEAELLKIDWKKMMSGDGTSIKAGLDKVWAITKLMPEGREGTEAGWIKYVLDRTPASLSMEYYQQVVTESIEVQQKAAKSTRSFAVILSKAKNNMMRRESLFNEDYLKGGAATQADGPLLQGDPPYFNMHEKASRDKGCSKCQLFGCAKAFDDEVECDIYGKPTKARVARIAKNEKYKVKVDTYRMEKKQEALDYVSAPSSNVHEFHEGERRMEWGEEMFALIDSLAVEDSTPEEPVEEEAPEIDDEGGAPKAMTHFSGFRQAYFEASQESNQREARRLGWSEYE